MTVWSPTVSTFAECLMAAVAAHLASWNFTSDRTAKTSSGVAAYSIDLAIFMRLLLSRQWVPTVRRDVACQRSHVAVRTARAACRKPHRLTGAH